MILAPAMGMTIVEMMVAQPLTMVEMTMVAQPLTMAGMTMVAQPLTMVEMTMVALMEEATVAQTMAPPMEAHLTVAQRLGIVVVMTVETAVMMEEATRGIMAIRMGANTGEQLSELE